MLEGDVESGYISDCPITRCQVYNGVAGRYFGMPESLLEELRMAKLSILHNRVFAYPDGWLLFESIARKQE